MDTTEKLKSLSIYEFMIISLTLLAVYNIIAQKFWLAAIQILISVLTATILDFSINHFIYKRTYFPKSAVISGLFVGSILYNVSGIYFVIIASALAILSKHLIKINESHLFNPASLGIFIATILGASQLWWTAQPLLLVVVLGLIIAWKFKRFDSQPAFLATYFIVSAIILFFAGDISKIILKITDPFIYFFTFFMLVEPRTSPLTQKGRIIYGVIVALLASATLRAYPAQFILSALLTGNVIGKFIIDKYVR